MSIQAISWVLDESPTTGNERCVLIAIANHFTKDEPYRCWPGVERLAREARCSSRTVQRALRSLEADGHLFVVPNAGGGPNCPPDRRPNVYVIAGFQDQAEEWAGAIARGVRLSPRSADRGDNPGRTGATLVSPDPSDDPSGTTPPAPRKRGERVEHPEFAAFYEAYPRKVGRPAAAKAFERALKRSTLDAVVEGLDRWAAYWRARAEPDKVPHPTTWLNQDRWNDLPPGVSLGVAPAPREGDLSYERTRVECPQCEGRGVRERVDGTFEPCPHDGLQVAS